MIHSGILDEIKLPTFNAESQSHPFVNISKTITCENCAARATGALTKTNYNYYEDVFLRAELLLG